MSLPLDSVRVEQISAREAAAFWNSAPAAGAFTRPEVLARMSARVDWWIARERSNDLIIWPVCRSADGRPGPPLLSYHVGPLESCFLSRCPAHRAFGYRVGAMRRLAESLLTHYRRCEGVLAPGCTDLRGLQWLAEDRSDHQLVLRARHTAVLPVRPAAEAVAHFNPKRRREVRDAASLGLRRLPDWDRRFILDSYRELATRQRFSDGVEGPCAALEGVLDAVLEGHGEVIVAIGNGGNPLGMLVLLHGRNCTELVVASTCAPPEWRSTVDTWMILEALECARTRGSRWLDFDGANTPRRAFRKHSYGALPAIYFEFSMEPRDE